MKVTGVETQRFSFCKARCRLEELVDDLKNLKICEGKELADDPKNLRIGKGKELV